MEPKFDIRSLSKRLAERGLSADTAVASLDALPFRPQCFEVTLSVGVLARAAGSSNAIAKLLQPRGPGLFTFASDADYHSEDPRNPSVLTEAEVVAVALLPNRGNQSPHWDRTIAVNESMVTASIPLEH